MLYSVEELKLKAEEIESSMTLQLSARPFEIEFGKEVFRASMKLFFDVLEGKNANN